MAAISCKACGGSVVFPEGSTVGICEYCGSTVTRSKIEDEQRDALHNRGNLLRMRGEYDRALSVFEQIIALDDTDAEAHWNAALCRYGIEYVKDPDTNKRIPTCHRASWDSILTDVDYLAAVKYADFMARRVYELDGKYIDEVQKQILAISHTEEPYDIFICYKESALDGSRTKDSVLAQDLYDRLTKEGYRVFFARISLEDTLGKQYESYIFSALNSAKVMLVVGTNADNINSPWVRNEWSRFLSLMKKDPSKVIIPCYRDMDPYDLPDELAVLQSQNMGKIGFVQDLLRGMEKFFKKSNPTNNKEKSSVTISSLLTRAELLLADKDYGTAINYYNRILDINPHCAEAYLGLLCAKVKSPKIDEVGELYALNQSEYVRLANKPMYSISMKDNPDYQKAFQFGDEKMRNFLREQNSFCYKKLKEIAIGYVCSVENNLQECESLIEKYNEERRSLKKRISDSNDEIDSLMSEASRLDSKRYIVYGAIFIIELIIIILFILYASKMVNQPVLQMIKRDPIGLVLLGGIAVFIASFLGGILCIPLKKQIDERSQMKKDIQQKISQYEQKIDSIKKSIQAENENKMTIKNLLDEKKDEFSKIQE